MFITYSIIAGIMESWEKEHIIANLPYLIENTRCTVKLLSNLISRGILTPSEKDEVNSKSTPAQKTDFLYQILFQRSRAFQVLKQTLAIERQSGALRVLNQCTGSEHIRKQGCIEYDKNVLLGQGNMNSKVFKGKMTYRNPVAVKRIKCNSGSYQSVMREVEILQKLPTHSNIVQFFHAEYVEDKCILIAFEMCSCTLEDCVKDKEYPFSRDEILRQTTTGLKFLHDNSIIHRDLKPANILIHFVDQHYSLVKLSDFGVSKVMDESRASATVTTFIGTKCWTPPEILKHVEAVRNNPDSRLTQTFATDIFPLGCIFYYVLTIGKHPFVSGVSCEHNILKGRYKLVSTDLTSKGIDYKPIIASMITADPCERSNCETVLMYISTPEIHTQLFQKINIDEKVVDETTDKSIMATEIGRVPSNENTTIPSADITNEIILETPVLQENIPLAASTVSEDIGPFPTENTASQFSSENKPLPNLVQVKTPLQVEAVSINAKNMDTTVPSVTIPPKVCTLPGSSQMKSNEQIENVCLHPIPSASSVSSSETVPTQESPGITSNNTITIVATEEPSINPTSGSLLRRVSSDAPSGAPSQQSQPIARLEQNASTTDLIEDLKGISCHVGMPTWQQFYLYYKMDALTSSTQVTEELLNWLSVEGVITQRDIVRIKVGEPEYSQKSSLYGVKMCLPYAYDAIMTSLHATHQEEPLAILSAGYFGSWFANKISLAEFVSVFREADKNLIGLLDCSGLELCSKMLSDERILQITKSCNKVQDDVYSKYVSVQDLLSFILSESILNGEQKVSPDYGLMVSEVAKPTFESLSSVISLIFGSSALKAIFSTISGLSSIKGRHQENLLHIAVGCGNISAIVYLIELGLTLSDKDGNDQTPLHYLGKWSSNIVEVTQQLVKLKVDMFAVSKGLQTVAHTVPSVVSTAINYDKWVELLIKLDLGKLLVLKDARGRTSLHCAMQNVDVQEDTVLRMVCIDGFDINVRDSQGYTFLHLGSWFGRSRSTLEGVLKAGGDYRLLDNYGRSPLHRATMGGNLEAVEYLLLIGANIHEQDEWGRTPLHYVGQAAFNHLAITLTLIGNGADINKRDNDGNTVAHDWHECWSKRKEEYSIWAKMLVESGCESLFLVRNDLGNLPIVQV